MSVRVVDVDRRMLEGIAASLLSVLPDGWRCTEALVWYSVERVSDMISVSIVEDAMGWGATLSVELGSDVSALRGKALSYVDTCMASTLPTPHQA